MGLTVVNEGGSVRESSFDGGASARNSFRNDLDLDYMAALESALVSADVREGLNQAMDKDYVDAKLEASEARTREAIAGLRGDMDGQFAQVDVKFAELKSEMAGIAAMLEARPDKKWFATAGLSVVALVVSVLILSFSRFDAGMAAGPVFESKIASMESRLDAKIGAKLEEVVDLVKSEKAAPVVNAAPTAEAEDAQ